MVICKPCFLRVHRFHQPYHRYHLSEYFKQGQHSCGKNAWKKIRENSVLPTLSGKKNRFVSGAFPIFPPTQWQKKSPQNRYPEHPHKNWRIRPRRKVTCAAKGGLFTYDSGQGYPLQTLGYILKKKHEFFSTLLLGAVGGRQIGKGDEKKWPPNLGALKLDLAVSLALQSLSADGWMKTWRKSPSAMGKNPKLFWLLEPFWSYWTTIYIFYKCYDRKFTFTSLSQLFHFHPSPIIFIRFAAHLNATSQVQIEHVPFHE